VKRALGVDAGGTATRWQLVDQTGAILAQGDAPPLSGHVYTQEARARARGLIASMAEAVRRTGAPDAVVAGVTGAGETAPELQAVFAEIFALPSARVAVAGDPPIAYSACFEPGQGILVYSGTGSFGVHLTVQGELLRVGGLGNLIDDGGSGFWMAQQALRAVLRVEEEQSGSGWATKLGRALAEMVGGADWDHVRSFVYGSDRGAVGGLAVAVAQAAEADDRAAQQILRDAGRELARLASCLLRRTGPLPVALAGRAAGLHPAILAAFRTALPADTPASLQPIDPASGAARMALRLSG
jgi:N-acetylglucosamine kinase-like BadF-type ATPase